MSLVIFELSIVETASSVFETLFFNCNMSLKQKTGAVNIDREVLKSQYFDLAILLALRPPIHSLTVLCQKPQPKITNHETFYCPSPLPYIPAGPPADVEVLSSSRSR